MTRPWRPQEPYDALPMLPPGGELETKVVLKQCVTARAALAELKQAVELIPEPGMLINTLPVLEARDSSGIENIVTTADRLFQHLGAEGSADPATKEALRYRHALLEGAADLGKTPLGTRTATTICTRIRGVRMDIRKLAGTALADARTGTIVYTPPQGEARIRELLANWERFLHEQQGLDPLVRMAVAHYQFEAIHPFTDGNGRTGRILNSLYLVQCGLLPVPVLYLSRYILRHRNEYYRRLRAVTAESAWEPWLLYMLRCVEETAAWTTSRIAAIRTLAQETATLVREELPKIYSRELVDVIFKRPYCRISDVVAARLAGRQAAARYLKAVAALGVLEERSVGREKLFVNAKLLEVLTDER